MHISVMVFGDDVQSQMAPFQGCNMGPIAPEFMQTVDVTNEVIAHFCADVCVARLAGGRCVRLCDAWQRDDASGPVYDASGEPLLVDGAIVVNLSADEARSVGVGFATLDEAAEDYDDRATREGDRFVMEDHFNSRWDSWVIGGRWGGLLKLLPGRKGHTQQPIEFDPEFEFGQFVLLMRRSRGRV